jgi:Notch-like protein
MCNCPGNFYGVTCQNDLAQYFGDCGSPCLNGGVCNQITGSGGAPNTFKCDCVDPNWTGTYCETAVVCSPNPCMNNGACRRGQDGKALCVCPGDYAGDTCETPLMTYFQNTYLALQADCRFGSPCMNGGTCTAGVTGAYSCKCLNGYFGVQCETPTACSPNPCDHDGICDMVDGEVVCYCPAGTIGSTCQWMLPDFLVPDCRFVPCENGGTCNLVDTTFQCSCPDNWSGDWCELSSHCDPSPCSNGGSCYFNGENPVCFCEGNWFGPLCQYEDLSGRVEDVESAVDHLNRINNVPQN